MTDHTPTDWRVLCAELFEIVEDEYSGSSCLTELRNRTATALAQPEPQASTNEKWHELFIESEQSGEPVPVSERLPGPEDCDANGIVWAWDSGCLRWDTAFWDAAFPSDTDITHWLPYWALPVPQQEAE
jgi:hypothetical protein